MQQYKKKLIFEHEYNIQNYDIEIESCKFKMGQDMKKIYNECKEKYDKIDQKNSISGYQGYLKRLKENISTDDQ